MHASVQASKPQRLLTAKEVEALTKIDIKTIYRYVQRGLIPYVRIESNVRFPEEDLLAWIEERTYRPRTRKAAQPCPAREPLGVSGILTTRMP